MRILVIEDYTPLRKAMVESLETAGYVVDTSAEGEEGLWYAQNYDYDTIVLDIMLPKMNGLEILETIRGEGKGVPMIIISARDSVERAGVEVKLTAREYSLLEYLALRAGEIVSRQEIWDHVYNYYEDASSNAVDVYIGYLRKKLGSDAGATYIQTRRGQGYLLEYQKI